MSSRTLSIDIQHDRVIYTLLDHGFKRVHIVSSECYLLSEKEQNSDATTFTGLQGALLKISSAVKNNYDKCVISIPANHFFFRTLELPFKNSKKIDQIIELELENYFPLQSETFDFDFCALKKNNKELTGANIVSVAGVVKDDLEEYRNCLTDSEISPDVITVGSGYAMALVFAETTGPVGISFLIYAESRFASIYVVRFGEIIFCRSFILDVDDPVSSVVKNFIQTHLAFNGRFKNRMTVNEIVISGTAKFLKLLVLKLEEQLESKVSLFNVFDAVKNISISSPNDNKGSDDLQNAIAASINGNTGGGGFNFNRQVSYFAVFYHDHKYNFIASILLMSLLLFTGAAQPVLNIHLMERSNERLGNDIERVFQECFPEITTIVDPVQQMQLKVDDLKEKEDAAHPKDHLLNIDILNAISQVLPSSLDVLITRFVRIEDDLTIAGTADQFNTIDKMKSFFDAIAIFKNVDIKSAAMDKVENRVKFSLRILL